MATLVTRALKLLCVLSCVSSLPLPFDLRLPSSAEFLSNEAEKLIRQLNLIPKNAVDVVVHGDDIGVPKIVEKPFRLPSLPDEHIDAEDLGHFAGYYKIEHSHDARMFYFFFQSRKNTSDPVVIWLTGGPGCSSELALFYENGPFSITKNLSLLRNEYGWDKVSNIIFVDQPIGSGFSYTHDKRDMRHDENGVSDDLYDFLQAFFGEHPELAENDFYIAGESYAGHYIPALSVRIHKANKEKEGRHINLKGFAIGNGLTNPAVQYQAYPDFALDMGIISQPVYDRINMIVPMCEMSIKLCGTDGRASCLVAFYVCNSIFNSIVSHCNSCNYYDVRKTCETKLCYDFSSMEKFLNLKNVRDALGVGDLDFVSCSPSVYEAMIMDWMRNMELGIPSLLEDGIQLLVYAGEYDLICNWLGNSRWVHSMEWSGQKEFAESHEIPFMVHGSQAGVLKSHGPLSFLKVHDAGHMVPMDQPQGSLEMMRRWMHGELKDANDLVSSM